MQAGIGGAGLNPYDGRFGLDTKTVPCPGDVPTGVHQERGGIRMERRTRTALGLTMAIAAALLLITATAALAGTRIAPAQGSPAASGAPLTLGTGTNLVYLTGANGMTLYFFGKDTVPGQTACTSDACKQNWPAATVPADGTLPAAPAGATGTFSTFVRSDDGTTQLAYDGHPLYYFAGDKAPGDTNGEGLFALWWVADVAGGLPAPSAAPSAAASAEASAAGETYTLALSSGGYLTGEDGKSLYVFAKDTTPNQSACTSDTCVQNWPAWTIDSGETVVAGSGVSGTIATFARADGSMQVTYNGKPLYTFAGDSKAGDTNGDGVGGVWSLAKP
jgi:predicted lipoprotein with Yx(FWY)xxD motif